MKRLPMFVCAGLLAAAAALLGACRHAEPDEAPSTPVRIQTVKSSSAQGSVRYSAQVVPDVQVDVTSRQSGYVSELLQVSGPDGRRRAVEEGDTVQRGAVLARIREGEYRDRLTEAQSALTQAKADLDRAAKLYENQNISRAEYDAALARSTGAQARYDQAAVTLRETALVAPISGYVLKRNIEVGSLAAPGAPALVLGDLSTVRVVFGVPDVLVARMKLGDPVQVRVQALPEARYTGKITRISASADQSSRVFGIECTFPNPGTRLKAGMIVSLELAEPQESVPAILLPLNAVLRSKSNPESYAIYVVQQQDEHSVVRERQVELGSLVGNTVAVTGGLAEGEQVVVTGATLVSDGQLVSIVP